MLPLRDKCREKIQGTEETEMKRRIVLALCVAVGIGLTLMMPAVQVYSADKEQRFPLLKLEQLNDQQRPFADEILRSLEHRDFGSLQYDVAQSGHGPAHVCHARLPAFPHFRPWQAE